ncbi:MAG: YHYH protein [Planctomycetes bacterium]|nr:YHYH protein [Planctomycetota bacterium]
MSAWLRKGNLDLSGKLVAQDRFIADCVTIDVTPTHLVVHSHNLPNHPTAFFPDWSRSADGNPGYIQEKHDTWHLPLVPRENPSHVAMNTGNLNFALPGGAIGIAVNGVVFFNPFDAGGIDASPRMDRCCGHPSPMYEYHYHKYPVCVKSPWTDEGNDHSPVIGFAFDGFPVYGPYERAGVMAKDDSEHPLDAFNGHTDPVRGFHYHATPGKFPYIVGGFWGVTEASNFRRGPRVRMPVQ